MTQMSLATKVSFTDEQLVDLFILACEGGSNYWCGRVDPLGTKGDAYEQMLCGFNLHDNEQGRDINVTPQMIQKAVALLPTEAPRVLSDVLSENTDAESGDIFLQLCAFGEIIYG